MHEVFSHFFYENSYWYFDYILIYSQDLDSHVEHLKQTLTILRNHKLFVKLSEFLFATTQVRYLGHIISGFGLLADADKIISMQN